MNPKFAVSVVIPAYNEEKRISSCLQSLQNQTFPLPYEVIVVDNNSTDTTHHVAKRFPVILVKEKKKGNIYALRTGIYHAHAPLILLTDADVIVPPTWIQQYYEFFLQHADAVGATGPFVYIDGSIVAQLYTKILNAIAPRLLITTTIGMNMGFRRTAYELIGGFDPSVNLQGDSYLGTKLLCVGPIGFLPLTKVFASGRRYSSIPVLIKEVSIRIINYLSLVIRGRSIVFSFEDVR